jgi:hypothetical protein
VEWLEGGGITAHPTYRQAGWHQESPWWGNRVRRRVGMRHHPLAEILGAFIATGLAVEHVAELGTGRCRSSWLSGRASRAGARP